MAINADVVIIGGGPIGLAHAWGIKQLNPALKVVVYEKYEEYQRRHTLIMQPKCLEALMVATNTVDNPDLDALLRQIEDDPNIRTNALEHIFKKVSKDLGVEIINQEIETDTLNSQLFTENPNVRLVIGADGTHSIISQSLFPEGNQIKHEFDFVLQLRFDIDGEYQPKTKETIAFYQNMLRQGLVANEYVGHFKDGKTPVTMQVMISKQDFARLQAATSKNPIFLFKDDSDPRKTVDHGKIGTFIQSYLKQTISNLEDQSVKIEQETIRISVNEAPATHANQIFNYHNETPVILVGDAGLGLSYFKGLNAGLESTAELLKGLGPSIEAGFTKKEQTQDALTAYSAWFSKEFAPRKVKEVEQYSTHVIRSTMKLSTAVQELSDLSMHQPPDPLDEVIHDYFNVFLRDPEPENNATWRPYPHRSHKPIHLGQWESVPVTFTVSRTLKIFIDIFKPYKSREQFYQDLRTPLAGINNFFVGIAKIVAGIFTLSLPAFADGVARTIRGAIEIATFPISWVVKPLFRGLITAVLGSPKIESNTGIQKLAHYGEQELSTKNMFELLAVCNDIHRKFNKSMQKGQSSDLAMDEISLYNALRQGQELSKEKIHQYFSLFTHTQEIVSGKSSSMQATP